MKSYNFTTVVVPIFFIEILETKFNNDFFHMYYDIHTKYPDIILLNKTMSYIHNQTEHFSSKVIKRWIHES